MILRRRLMRRVLFGKNLMFFSEHVSGIQALDSCFSARGRTRLLCGGRRNDKFKLESGIQIKGKGFLSKNMKVPVYSKEGNKKGEIVLNPEIFSAPVNQRLLELVHKAYRANLRRGTADTKTRKEVRGGGKKPWRQKGTGRARHGSIRSPIWKGGGTTFGPHPRSYYVNLPSTMRAQALISALSLRGEQKNLFLLEDVKLETPKTAEWAEIVKNLPLEGKKALCVVKDVDLHLERASRNMLRLVEIQRARDINAYHVLQREKIILEEEALPILENRLRPRAQSPETSRNKGKNP